VLSIVQSTRGGKDYDSNFATRQVGTGVFADLLARRFQLASERYGMKRRHQKLRTDLFKPPVQKGGQMSLF
jgi:hypothetical protein